MKLKGISVSRCGSVVSGPYNKKIWTYRGISYFTNDRAPAIYKIIDTRNGEFYLGSTDLVFKRIGQHKTHLRSNCHSNRKLQSIHNKYGEDTFEFEILELLPLSLTREEVYEREQELLDELKPSLNLATKVIIVECQNRVEIHKYSFEGEYICTYPSFLAAGNDVGISESTIRQASKKGSVAGGFLWSREKHEAMAAYKRSKGSRSLWKYGNYKIEVFSYETGNLLNTYTSREGLLVDHRENKWDWDYMYSVMKGNLPFYKGKVYKLTILGKIS